MQPLFESPRLLFREFTSEDATLIYELNSDPEVLKYLHELPTINIERALQIITERIIPQYREQGYGRWAVYLKEEERFIGWCGLKFRSELNETDMGYRFLRPYWGKGYAYEAAKACLERGFSHHQLPTITARAHVDNLASLRIIEKCGMHFHCFEEVDGCPVKTWHGTRQLLRTCQG